MDIEIRPATADDAYDLAALIEIAGEGLPNWLWAQMAGPGQSPTDVGAERARRTDGGFSHRNAHVAVAGGKVVGMLLGYRQSDEMDPGDLTNVPGVIRPMIELECAAPGTWYVNAIAVLPDHQGRGIGSKLMALAEDLAKQSRARGLSLIVFSPNTGAHRLYQRLGYVETARRPIVPFEGFVYQTGDCLLMVKSAPVD